MRYKLSKELKEAIIDLPDAEKNKLLLRLLPLDNDLCEKLEFELVEEGNKLQARRDKISAAIEKVAADYFYNPGWLQMELKSTLAEITRHQKLTNDKEGEILLHLQLLNRVIETQNQLFNIDDKNNSKLIIFVVDQALEVCKKIKKLHSDLHVEFETETNALLNKIHNSAAAKIAKEMQLPSIFGA